MLTIDNFNKSRVEPTHYRGRTVMLTPKEPVPGLEGLEILVFETRYKQMNRPIWGWEWKVGTRLWYSSLRKDGWPELEEQHLSIESASDAALKSASSWSDEERIPREQKARQERNQKDKRLDEEVDRFLAS